MQAIDAVETVLTNNFNVKILSFFKNEPRVQKAVAPAIIAVQSYSFTSKPIADALIEASLKSIKVMVLFDKSQLKAPYSQIHRLKKVGIRVRIDNVEGIAHNKVIIVDSARLITGSYNFSKAANTRNSENMLFINDEKLAKIYRDKWFQRFGEP